MTSQPKPKAIDEVLVSLPPLPITIRYYDNFSDSYDQVVDPDDSDQWRIRFDGRNTTLDFEKFNVRIRSVVKSWCAFMLGTLSPRTVQYYSYGIRRIPPIQVIGILTSTPQEIRSRWKALHSDNVPYEAFEALENLLTFMCRFSVGSWAPEWRDLVSQLPLPKVDKYASVRAGDVFLTTAEEAAIVRHIDDVSARIQSGRSAISDDLLETTAILVCSHQFGFRVKQIAMLKMRNIRIWNDGLEDLPAVHLTFTMIKQRSAKRVFSMVRKVKREWSPLFVELFHRAHHGGLIEAEHVFKRTPDECGQAIADTTELVGKRRRTAVELRHTAAQRLVDAGASEEELAAFMGHSDLNTGLIYFQFSLAQAERVNRALGISATYQRVAKIAHDQFITTEELADLKGDQQIGGVPHGIPITGIGGCSQGQPSCPYNPIMSCYGCTRFMPVADIATHKQVLEDMRGVLKFFYAASRGERGSPAFQLERTISNVQAVIEELGAERHELTS
jgi:integrase